MKKLVLLIVVLCLALSCGCSNGIRTIDLKSYPIDDPDTAGDAGLSGSLPKTGYADEDEVYYLVGMHIILPYWQDHKKGLKVAAEELGVKYVFTGESGNDAVRQADLFRQVIGKKPAGILVSPIDPELMIEPINDAIAQGIPVVCVDTDSPKSKRYTYFGTGNYNAGYEGARILAKSMGYRGDIGILTSPGIYCLDERQRGVEDFIKENCPYIHIVSRENDKADPSKAANVATKMFKDMPQITGVFGVDAASGVGIAIALRQTGRLGKVKVVVFDKDSSVLELVSQGVIETTMVQRTFTMSYYGLKFLYDLNHRNIKMASDMAGINPLPPHVDTGIIAVGKNNVIDIGDFPKFLPIMRTLLHWQEVIGQLKYK